MKIATFLMLLAMCLVGSSHVLSFGLDELEQIEKIEALDLTDAAIDAAKNDDVEKAERLLNEATGKIAGEIDGQAAKNAIANAKERIAERERQEERRRQEREVASSSGSRGPSLKDFYNACLGSTDYNSNCYSVDDPELKKLCLARSERKDLHCYGIRSEDMKNLCLGISNSSYASSCYAISDGAMKDTCLAASSYGYHDRCYAITEGPWKLFCGGLALSSNNCYNLR